MLQLQQKREEAEKAREEALKAQAEAGRQREELERKLQEVERQAQEAAALKDWRARLQLGDKVHVPRYDKTGVVKRVDHKRNMAVVSLGLGQWEVSLEEVFPGEKESR